MDGALRAAPSAAGLVLSAAPSSAVANRRDDMPAGPLQRFAHETAAAASKVAVSAWGVPLAGRRRGGGPRS